MVKKKILGGKIKRVSHGQKKEVWWFRKKGRLKKEVWGYKKRGALTVYQASSFLASFPF